MPDRSAPRPEGWSDLSYYLAMRDGIRLALSIYFPNKTLPTDPCPVVLILTRYGRATANVRRGPGSINCWLQAGYIGCAVDVRGTTASFGSRRAELDDDEQQDAEEIVAHIAAQSWCNGKVIATGTSYSGNTADLAATRQAPALVAVIPCATDFDWWELFWPGGVCNDALLRTWARAVGDIDFGKPFAWGDVTAMPQHAGLDGRDRLPDCLKLFPTLQPVDEDAADGSLLQLALRTREEGGRHWMEDDYNAVHFRDDKGRNDHSFLGSSAAGHISATIYQAKPMQSWASWVDANTAEMAINRYLAAPNIPSVVIITAHNHSSSTRADPLLPGQVGPVPTAELQDQQRLQFASEVMEGRTPERVIKYYVLGSGQFRETSAWPPVNTEETHFWLSENRQLVSSSPVRGTDVYVVDPTTTTGIANRWNQSSTPAYDDRRLEDGKLLCYDAAPMDRDIEIAGWPAITLHMSTQTDDPTVFAYLEDVSPEGRVTYITEGILRLVNRKLAAADALPFIRGPYCHTFNREDAMPVVPGNRMAVSFRMYATAAMIRRGHHIRLSIAGADANTFISTVSTGKKERFDLYRGGLEASVLSLPLRHVLEQ